MSVRNTVKSKCLQRIHSLNQFLSVSKSILYKFYYGGVCSFFLYLTNLKAAFIFLSTQQIQVHYLAPSSFETGQWMYQKNMLLQDQRTV